MATIISLFNHKGGVSKTTTTFNLGCMLSNLGKRVLLVDADSQCNLTGLVLGEMEFEDFYQVQPENNIKMALDCAFQGKPKPIETIDGVTINDNLFLIPGHIDITEFDISLGMAHNFSNSMPVLLNLPGSFFHFINIMAGKFQADIVLIDMNPSLSAMNQNLLMISNFFMIPTTPDFFSQMAIGTLSYTVPKWKKWAITAKEFYKESDYPFPQVDPKFLGIIMQNFTIRNGRPVKAFQEKIDAIIDKVETKLIDSFQKHDLLLKDENREIQKQSHYCLQEIPDFQSLIAKMQDFNGRSWPVFAIPDEYLGAGTVQDNYLAKKEELYNVFYNLADYILRICQ